MPPRNLLKNLPPPGPDEDFETLFEAGAMRIERIVSHRNASPPGFWYDQAGDEWVMLVQGTAELEFDDGRRIALAPGDWLVIPAGRRHRVASTGPDTVWLAVHGTKA
ncbi:cupin domain-containing protein [Zoogloea sp. LCSB751]|uniref:cupin domain-containing protein n=1 Tax=Zoogloea sp. LCSB751 TaxID=1965277 RepID=UPI0009A4A432|nr:cupin domain-containing protein [Zoogloea sp. LCSB751]